MYAYLEPPTTWVGFAITLASILAILAFAFFIVWYQRGRARDTTVHETLTDYKELAEARGMKLADVVLEKEEAERKLATALKQLEKAQFERDNHAQLVLRLVARQERMEEAINQLELQLGRDPTNFNDPVSHLARETRRT